jgi:hypothetical protein
MIRIFLSQPEFDHCTPLDEPNFRTSVCYHAPLSAALISAQKVNREDLAGPNTKLFGERTMANPNLGATLIRYARSGCMGGNSVELQDDAMDAWLRVPRLEADSD